MDYFDDGVIKISNGKVTEVIAATEFAATGGKFASCEPVAGLIVPGFIDTHIHYSQMNIIASYGTQLLDWLEQYAFPAESAFAESDYAEAQAALFLEQLFRHGTTTALTFTTVHAQATDALFAAAQQRGARMIAGKVLMNRNAPDELLDMDDGAAASAELIERWHGKDRLLYAVTPRFAITSTDAQLRAAGELLEAYPGVYLHTHLAEHPSEIAATLELFPGANDYVEVYERFGLVNSRSLFAHGIHLSDSELTRLSEADSCVAFCPTSNMFLGSGLLKLARLREFSVRVGVATDVGGGTSFSMLATLADGYKVTQLNGESWHPLTALHAITRGNALALGLGDKIGRIAPGYEADLTVLHPRAGSILEQRLATADTLTEQIFATMLLSGDDAIERTYVAGERAYQRKN